MPTRARTPTDEATLRDLDRAFHLPVLRPYLKVLGIISPRRSGILCKSAPRHTAGCNGFLGKDNGRGFIDLTLEVRDATRRERCSAEINEKIWEGCGILLCGAGGCGKENEVRKLFDVIDKALAREFGGLRTHAMDWEPTTVKVDVGRGSGTGRWIKR